jgi:hypothetical protein
METKKLGQEPAFPFFETNASGYENTVVDTPTGRLYLPFQSGMSKRFYAAMGYADAATEYLKECSANNILEILGLPITTAYTGTIHYAQALVKMQYIFADELLKQENQ